MKTRLLTVLAFAVVAALLTSGVWAGEENVWVTKTGHAIHMAGENEMFFGDDAQVLNASDLRDGESRTVGIGEKQVTLTRNGKIVTIVREATADKAKVEILCDAGRDTCQVITFDDEPEKVVIVVEKTRECVNDVGDCDAHVVNLERFGGGGAKHIVIKRVECDDQGNCTESEIGGDMTVDVDVTDMDAPHAIFLHRGLHEANKVTLACPEGDSTIHVDKQEALDTFLCPKHSVPMEKQANNMMIRKIRLDGK